MSAHQQTAAAPRTHHAQPVLGRDPHQRGRTATNLELLFDLVFVIAIGQAASQFAHLLAEGHVATGIGAFMFGIYAVLWAWISYSWYSSAFDNDDWIQRLATMVQMVGATVLALGLPAIFHSIDAGDHLDNRVAVAGYVVMRLAMVFQWLRAAHQNPEYRKTYMTYVWAIVIAQTGWVGLALFPQHMAPTIAICTALLMIELAGPYLAETRHAGTPWHAHHIAERYGLLTIIGLGEGIVGTVASLSAIVEVQGWTLDAAFVVIAGLGLTFGMWWVYFLVASGEVLQARRNIAFHWAYGGMAILASIAATGAGLHVAALYIEHKAQIGPVAAVVSLTIPVACFLLGIFWLYSVLYDERHWFHLFLLVVTALILASAPAMAVMGVSVPVCLLVVMIAPALCVIGYEAYGYKHVAKALERVTAQTF